MAQATRTSNALRVDAQGRIVIPAEIREKLGLEPGTRVILTVKDGALEIQSRDKAIRRVQEMVRARTKGRSLVDELIAERHAEAARE
ncbi:MAG TPA: AbrB/MazE/SpoVT family DNA-binding domain-containing protein [Dehalococcoidia bacterium]|nr:AbrB/MazE/SpoVT family DNA-binding domain-containing protein [Dehalococcoidia bacterium]